MSSKMEKVYRRHPEVVYRTIAGEAILIPISRQTQQLGRMLTLNETGALIWESLDGSRSLAAVLERIQEEYWVEADQARADLLELIGELAQSGAVAEVDRQPPHSGAD